MSVDKKDIDTEQNSAAFLQNPNHPKTKEYLMQLQNLIERDVLFLTAIHQFLRQNTIDMENRQAQVQAQLEKHMAAQRAYHELLDQLAEAKAKTATSSDLNLLNSFKEKFEAKVIELEKQLGNLQNTLSSLEKRLTDTHSDINVSYRDNRKKLSKAIVEGMQHPKKGEIKAYGLELDSAGNPQRKPIDQGDLNAVLTKLETTRPLPTQILTKALLEDQLAELIKKDENKFVNQAENKMRVMDQLTLLRELGGEEVTPTHMLALLRFNKDLLKLYDECSSDKLIKNANEKDIKEIIGVIQEIQIKKVEINGHLNQLGALKENIESLQQKIDAIKAPQNTQPKK